MAQWKNKFEVLHPPDAIGFVFSSNMDNIDRACRRATRFLRSKIPDVEDKLFAVNLGIREGLTNAVRHGNRGHPEKEIRLLLAIEGQKRLIIEIEDQGSGFDWKQQQKKSIQEDRAHGRGIQILGMYFNRYSYSDKGNILYLEKDISP